MDYESFVAGKMRAATFGPVNDGSEVAEHLYPFQADLVGWALRKGRAALFADTGLGKTAMQIEWARQCASHGQVLILAPLAVADQTVREAARFGVPVAYCREHTDAPIMIANYEMLRHFDPSKLAGVVLDESSILKAVDGKTRTHIIQAFEDTPYRLACTATPAPNDHTELGNHSEFLGALSRAEMLAEFFVHDGGSTQNWRLKGHAREAFWGWVSTWGAVVKKPSDLGYDDGRYDLAPLKIHEERIEVDHSDVWGEGLLFAPAAVKLNDQRKVRKATLPQRVECIRQLTEDGDQWLVWCEYNREAAALTKAIDGAVNVQGSDSPEVKRDRLMGFTDGSIRVLVTKPSIAGFGMNWQQCNHMAFVGPSHSYEQTYQAIRRCWRFGQTKPVHVHIVAAATERAIVANYRRKERAAEELSTEMRRHIGAAIRDDVGAVRRRWTPYDTNQAMRLPTWLVQGE